MTQVAAPRAFIQLHSRNYSNDLRLSLSPPEGCLPADLCMSPAQQAGSGRARLPFSLPPGPAHLPVLMGGEWEELEATGAASLKMGDPHVQLITGTLRKSSNMFE